MANVISLVSSKGGTGKTTTALNLALALAESGRRTLLLDLDPQGAIALALAKGDTEWSGLAELMLGSEPLEKVIVETKVPTLEILPRGRLDPVDTCTFEGFLSSTDRLSELIDRLRPARDYIIVDNPSGLGQIVRAALTVSDFAIVPLQAEPLALRSVGQTLRVIAHVQQEENPRLKLLGVLPTMVELRQDTSLNVMSAVWSGFATVFDTCIPRAEVFARASERGLPVGFLSRKPVPDARRFAVLANEIELTIASLNEPSGAADETTPRQLV